MSSETREMTMMRVLRRYGDNSNAIVSYTDDAAAQAHMFREEYIQVPVRKSRRMIPYAERQAASFPKRSLADVAKASNVSLVDLDSGEYAHVPEGTGTSFNQVYSASGQATAGEPDTDTQSNTQWDDQSDTQSDAPKPVPPPKPVTLKALQDEVHALNTIADMVAFGESKFGATVDAKKKKEDIRAQLLGMASAQFSHVD